MEMILEGVDAKIEVQDEVIKIYDKQGKETKVPIKDLKVTDLKKKGWTDGYILLNFPGSDSIGKRIKFKEEHQAEFETFAKLLGVPKKDEAKRDGQILLTVHGESPINGSQQKVQLTATDLIITSLESGTLNPSKKEEVVQKIPRSSISQITISAKTLIILSVTIPRYVMVFKTKQNEITILFEFKKLNEIEQLFSEVDSKNYKTYVEEKPKIIEQAKVAEEVCRDKIVEASELIKSPQEIDEIKGAYALLREQMNFKTQNNLIRAINLMATHGWKCISMVYDDEAHYTYVLMSRINLIENS